MATVDLPDPDSPTIPSRWPARIVSDNPSTARTVRAPSGKSTTRSSIVRTVPSGSASAGAVAHVAWPPGEVEPDRPVGSTEPTAAPALPLRCTATSMPSLTSM